MECQTEVLFMDILSMMVFGIITKILVRYIKGYLEGMTFVFFFNRFSTELLKFRQSKLSPVQTM